MSIISMAFSVCVQRHFGFWPVSICSNSYTGIGFVGMPLFFDLDLFHRIHHISRLIFPFLLIFPYFVIQWNHPVCCDFRKDGYRRFIVCPAAVTWCWIQNVLPGDEWRYSISRLLPTYIFYFRVTTVLFKHFLVDVITILPNNNVPLAIRLSSF